MEAESFEKGNITFYRMIRKRFIEFFSDRRNQIITISLILLLLLFITVGEFVKAVFLLFTLNFLLSFFLRPTKKFRIGIELILFSTVMCSIAYGPKVGIVVGAVSAIINYVGYKRISTFSIIVIPAYMLIGWIAYYLRGFDIGHLGLFFSVLYTTLIILK